MKLYSELYDLETVCLRYFNIYGERQSATSDYSGVISIFEQKFQNDEVPNIYGDGEQYRNFVYVKDVVANVNDLFNTMNDKYAKNIKANYLDNRDGDIKESICDTSKITQILNINNFIKFEDGVVNI